MGNKPFLSLGIEYVWMRRGNRKWSLVRILTLSLTCHVALRDSLRLDRELPRNMSFPWNKLWFFPSLRPFVSCYSFRRCQAPSIKDLMWFLHLPYIPAHWPLSDLCLISQSWSNKSWRLPKLLIESLGLYWLSPLVPPPSFFPCLLF